MARAALVAEEQRAVTLLERLGKPAPIRHPVRELLDLAAEVKAWQQILRERVDELANLNTTDTLGTERERAAVLLYERALDRSSRLYGDLTRLDLQARRLSLDEQDAKRIMEAISEAVRRAGLGVHDQSVRRHLADVLAGMNTEDDDEPAGNTAR